MHHINKLLFLIFILFISNTALRAQEVGEILWQDDYSDTATDPGCLKNVGWMYYGENDGLVGAVVEQTEDGTCLMQTGNFSEFVGAVLKQSNGCPEIDTADTERGTAILIDSSKGGPNVEITFNVNFKLITSTAFSCATRMVQGDLEEDYPDSDPRVQGSYQIVISPLTNDITISRVFGVDEGGVELGFLFADSWQYIAETTEFEVDQNVPYWVKFWLYGGDMKMKIWEGLLEDEEEGWLLEGSDPEARVPGTFTQFGLLGNVPTATDQVELDNIVVRLIGEPVGVENSRLDIPNTFELKNNYPNPFNPTTNIEFSLAKENFTSLKIYSVTGELVKTLASSNLQAGTHSFVFEGKDENGSELSSGMYIYELVSGTNISAKKMFLIK